MLTGYLKCECQVINLKTQVIMKILKNVFKTAVDGSKLLRRLVVGVVCTVLIMLSATDMNGAFTCGKELLEIPTYGHGSDIAYRSAQMSDEVFVCGTSVFQVTYAEEVDYRIRTAFEFACKVWEDCIPMGYPIRVKVEQKSFGVSSTPKLSTVNLNAFSLTGDENAANNDILLTLSQVKSILFKEYGNHTQLTHFPLDQLSGYDFTVTYNGDCIDMFWFNESRGSSNRYDFISVAIQDIAKGLGFACAFDADNTKKVMTPLGRKMLPFEKLITQYNSYLYGNYVGKSVVIPAYVNSARTARLQFPSMGYWEKGTSLNRFLPVDSVGISSALQDGIGYANYTRFIHDKYFADYFMGYLGWGVTDGVAGIRALFSTVGGLDLPKPTVMPEDIITTLSSSLKLYELNAKFFHLPDTPKPGTADELIIRYLPPSDKNGLYLQKKTGEWYAYKLLKKDGVTDSIGPKPGLDMSQFVVNREGFYRAVAVNYKNYTGICLVAGAAKKVCIKDVEYAFGARRSLVTFALQDIETAHKLIIKEEVREFGKLPVYNEIDLSGTGTRVFTRTYPASCTVLLTPYATSQSGTTAVKGETLEVVCASVGLLSTTVEISGNAIVFEIDSDEEIPNQEYSITPLSTISGTAVLEGDYNDNTVIDISHLSSGTYVLKYQSEGECKTKTFIKK